MRRWPTDRSLDFSGDLEIGPPNNIPQAAGARGDRVRAFTVAGGTPRWPFVPYAVGNPMEDGVQLLCSFYVGEGEVGFVKGIKACPFKPSILHNSEYTELVPDIGQGTNFTNGNFSDSDNGWWSTPFGWEGYTVDEGLGGDPPPTWSWQIQFVPGKLSDIRNAANIPPFAFLDASSWLLAPNVPVPASAYQQGLPGISPPGWGAQRLQWFGEESGQVHIIVPANTSVCLFARWTQLVHNVTYQATNGAGTVDLGRDIYILGPSFGQLTGYTQPRTRIAAGHNVAYGWNS